MSCHALVTSSSTATVLRLSTTPLHLGVQVQLWSGNALLDAGFVMLVITPATAPPAWAGNAHTRHAAASTAAARPPEPSSTLLLPGAPPPPPEPPSTRQLTTTPPPPQSHGAHPHQRPEERASAPPPLPASLLEQQPRQRAPAASRDAAPAAPGSSTPHAGAGPAEQLLAVAATAGLAPGPATAGGRERARGAAALAAERTTTGRHHLPSAVAASEPPPLTRSITVDAATPAARAPAPQAAGRGSAALSDFVRGSRGPGAGPPQPGSSSEPLAEGRVATPSPTRSAVRALAAALARKLATRPAAALPWPSSAPCAAALAAGPRPRSGRLAVPLLRPAVLSGPATAATAASASAAGPTDSARSAPQSGRRDAAPSAQAADMLPGGGGDERPPRDWPATLRPFMAVPLSPHSALLRFSAALERANALASRGGGGGAAAGHGGGHAELPCLRADGSSASPRREEGDAGGGRAAGCAESRPGPPWGSRG